MVADMIGKIWRVWLLSFVLVAACISSTRDAIKNVGLGMSTEEVRATAGAPTAQAEQGSYQAWRYEYRVLGPCTSMGSRRDGGGRACRQICEHATVWFNDNEVRSITGIRVDSLKDCGQSSTPIYWEQMPGYAKGPSTWR